MWDQCPESGGIVKSTPYLVITVSEETIFEQLKRKIRRVFHRQISEEVFRETSDVSMQQNHLYKVICYSNFLAYCAQLLTLFILLIK